MPLKIIFLAICLFGAVFSLMKAEPVEDKQALLDFLQNISHTRSLNWDNGSSACNDWIGITCNHDESRVIAVQLPGFGFRGSIPSNTLSRLSALQILRLRSNGLSGPFPSDFSKLINLNTISIESNKFSGPLPVDFSVWGNLSIVNLSKNLFNGTIPYSISNLTQLIALNLSNNLLSGDITDLNIPSLQVLDLSYNNLAGVPQSLQRFPTWAFSSNNLSIENLSPLLSPAALPKAHPSKRSTRLGEPAILGITIGSSALSFVLIAVLIVCYSNKDGQQGVKEKPPKKEKSGKRLMFERESQDGRLVFFEGHNLVFDLEDLLRASAEVLGKGTFGTTYRAALEDATTVVVKRLKQASLARREFEQQMEAVGNIRHENIAPLRAYYYSKEEKLMVYDHYSQGSMSSILHGTGDRISLDWEARLRVAMGAARGIAHIHAQSGGKLVHGSIKASNVFLNTNQYGCISDLGLATLMSPTSPSIMRTGGYRAPEVKDTRKVSQASDVYSFGVFLLELLTGKSPIHGTGGEEAVHLVRWVHSVVREEWTAEVFDVELLRYPNIDEEMVEMLQIAMACAARMPEQRPKMADVTKRIDGLRRVSLELMSEDSTPTLTPPVAD